MADSDRSSSPETSPLAAGENLAPLPEYKPAGNTSVDLSGLLDEPVKLHEDLSSGCGGQLWPAGMVLARHMLRYHREQLGQARMNGWSLSRVHLRAHVSGVRMQSKIERDTTAYSMLTLSAIYSLELGAGSGLVGLTIAQACSVETPLYLTDQVEMESLMQHNIVLNRLQDKAKALVLNWGEPLPQEIVRLRPDTILAADCVYFEPAFPLLLQTLRDLLALYPAATVYFCFKKRRRADMHFLAKAKKMFRVTEARDEERPLFRREALFLYTFTARI